MLWPDIAGSSKPARLCPDRRPVRLEALLQLPGRGEENVRGLADVEGDWPLVEETLDAAMDNMAHMRAEEGRAMADDLAANCAAIAVELEHIDRRGPEVAGAYRSRLSERLNKTLAEFEVTLDEAPDSRSQHFRRAQRHLGRNCPLAQPSGAIRRDHDAGRKLGTKLEFLTQEMFRETNTIGSKANDVTIARHVIEIKAAIERMREMIQNVE